MIKIDFPEPTNAVWKKWREKCDLKTTALNAAVAAGKEHKISELYKKQKEVYFDTEGPFHGKCAFCEVPIHPGQPGDIEHFRPKNGVTDENREPVFITDGDGHRREHPGYYWLAYDWKNFLPSCRNCNSPNCNKTGTLFGKHNCFPVDGQRAWRPGDERLELPLLINPAIDDPADHLDIDETCILFPRNCSQRGEMCIRIFGLNERDDLLDTRLDVYREARRKTIQLLEALHHGNIEEQANLIKEITNIKAGKSPFSVAGRLALSTEQNLVVDPIMRLLGSGGGDA